jgi:hypothetical protein
MTNLRAAMRDYLAIRRRLGFTLARHGVLLPDFVAYLSAADAEHVTTELALAWATLPADYADLASPKPLVNRRSQPDIGIIRRSPLAGPLTHAHAPRSPVPG